MTRSEVERFDAGAPIERARTPPASWYLEPEMLEAERRAVFHRSWQCVGPLERLAGPGDYLSGDIAGEPFVVVRGDDRELRAFFNVCRHHASELVRGEGKIERFVCPYHGWTYDLDGRLRKAPRVGGRQGFDRDAFGLVPLQVATWGPLVFVRIAHDAGPAEPLDGLLAPLDGRIDAQGLRFVARRSYELDCNWKVFVDNYLDGGYHVAHLHGGLAGQLDLDSYRTEISGKVSLQLCAAGGDGTAGADFAERLGGGAVYAFIHPNFMINRYGPIMDTNWVLPLGAERTRTVFDYYFEPGATDPAFVERSLAASDRVQREDVEICESVQRGLRSAAYDTGIYAPTLEHAALQFHRQLAADLRNASTSLS